MRIAIAIASLGAMVALWRAVAPAPSPTPAHTASVAAAASVPAPILVNAPRPAAAAPKHAPSIASVEAAVHEARRRGKGEQEVHRLRSAGMPAAQVEAIGRMEAAEASWRRRLEALQSACSANLGCDDARASFTREELARVAAYSPPTLRQ